MQRLPRQLRRDSRRLLFHPTSLIEALQMQRDMGIHGTQRSVKCGECKKRRVACDRERPTCDRCRRSNRRCSGYEAQYLFVPPITPRRPQLRAPHQRTHSGLTSPSPSITSDSPSGSVVEIAAATPVHHDVPTLWVPGFVAHRVPHFVLEQQRPVPDSVGFTNIRTLNSPPLFQSQLLANYTDAICPDRRLPRELCLFREWLGGVPHYLGTSEVLGYALECLTRAYYARSNNPNNRKDIELASCKIYVRAIQTLSRVLNTSECRSSQTLCATLFLSQYEFLASTPGVALIKHAGGAAELMRQRGPEAHRHGFENAMLRAFRPKMICSALVNRVACFLDNDAWRSVLHHESQSQGLNADQSVRLSDQFYENLAELPGLVESTNRLHRAPNPTVAQMLLVLQRTRGLRSALLRWYRRLTAGTTSPFPEVPSRVGDSLFPLVYRYENHHTTGLVCSYYASLIVINDILSSFPPCDDLSADNICYAQEICKSVEYAYLSGFQGAYTIIFPLTTAYLAAGTEVRKWIKDWPSKFEKYFDVAIWQENFDNMEETGGPITKRRHGKDWNEWIISIPPLC